MLRLYAALLVVPLSLLMSSCCNMDAGTASASPAPSSTARPVSHAHVSAASKADEPFLGHVLVSCRTSKNLCSEWTHLTREQLREARTSCSLPGEKFGTEPCPRHNLLGTCEHTADKLKMYTYKSNLASTVDEAHELCEDGVFTAAGRSPPSTGSTRRAR